MNDCLCEAIYNNDINLVKYYLTKDINFNLDCNKALKQSVIYNRIDILKLLILDKRTNPHCGNDVLLKLATRFNYVEIVEILVIEAKIKPDNYKQQKKYLSLGFTKSDFYQKKYNLTQLQVLINT